MRENSERQKSAILTYPENKTWHIGRKLSKVKKIRIEYNSAEKTPKDPYAVNTAIGPRASDSC